MTTMKKILILSANPRDTARLRLDEEVREIEDGLRLSEYRNQFDIRQRWAVRLRDLRRTMLYYKPNIVHFCGHGEEDGLMVEDEHGNATLVSSDALSELFELLSDQVECVLLNACYSQTQAEAIARHINYVIGMSKRIDDRAAIEFAVGFYDALGAGKSYKEAFKFGRNAIQLYNIPKHLTPILKKKSSSLVQHRKRLILVLSATIDDVNRQKVEAIVEHLRQISGDLSLTLEEVLSGSVILIIECSYDGYNTIISLFKKGELTKVSDIPVLDIQSEVPIKSEQGIPQKEKRFLDAAIPEQVVVNEETELITMIRMPDSRGLREVLEEDLQLQTQPQDVKSKDFELRFPLDKRGNVTFLDLWIDIETNDFILSTRRKKIRVYPSKNSAYCIFLLTPRKKGLLRLIIHVKLAEIVIATGYLQVNGHTKINEGLRVLKTLITLPLGVFAIGKTKATGNEIKNSLIRQEELPKLYTALQRAEERHNREEIINICQKIQQIDPGDKKTEQILRALELKSEGLDSREEDNIKNGTKLQNLYRNEPECGIAPREKVFSLEEDLPGQVFNIELLTKPILLRKHRDNIHVFLDRDDVRWGVYNREGRKKVNELTFLDEAARKKAIQYDKEIHRFFTQGKNDESFLVSLPNLRWASGGVLSIVKFKDRKWVPFFFRDIPPYGWQIPQGASEKKTDDLNDPWSFMIREFLEEVLICHDDEQSPTIIRHPFSFERLKIEKEIQSANELSHKHDTLRFRRDGMQIIAGKPIAATIVPTNTSLEIRHNNKMQPLRHDVLVLFNITELGIEVVKVVRYQLGNNEYILDGEIYDPYGRNEAELLRAPVVLISVDYLHRSFKNMLDYTFTYEFDATFPSIEAPSIPSKDDIHIFSPDVLRRLEIVLGTKPTFPSTPWEKKRYTGWYNDFGKYFFDSNNNLTHDNACPLFTPTAAKVMRYYFAFC